MMLSNHFRRVTKAVALAVLVTVAGWMSVFAQAGSAEKETESRRRDPQDSVSEVCKQSSLEQRSLITEAEKNNFGVRRVEFFGLTYTRDRVVRARMTPFVNEGDVFSHERLLKSLKSMSRLSKVIYPLRMSDVILSLDRTEHVVDMTICFKERRR